ncbi:O-unit flippase-like protein [Ferruginibacter paludis]|uniref:O-unit flippase-like protein n=1 Tax=Ferruginibacter paludis TaxID=1310417 RepID=UPI0025B4C2CD|nr:O-unit flippase-like protein [Ferruginibacter paludis]MDN3657619.1 O-unit flippase-like protein [Ferruginibacter paludis]
MSITLSKKDIIWGYFAQFFSIASGMIMLPIILRMLTPDEIGMNYLMLTVGSMVSLFDFGFAPQFGRNITYIFSGAQSLQKEGVEEQVGENKAINYRLLSTMIHTAKSVYRLLSVIVLVVMLTFGSVYIYKVTNGFTNVHNSFVIWIVYSVSTFVNIYYTYYSSLLTGRGMIMESKKAMVYSKIVYIILSATMLFCGVGLLGVAIANLISPFVNRYLSNKFFFTPELKELLDRYEITKQEKVDLFKVVWHNSKKLGLVYIGSYAITRFSMFLAGLYLSLKEIASYGLMMQFVSIILTLSGTLFVLNEPRLSALKVEGDKKLLLKTFSFSMGVYYALYFILGAGFILLGPWVLTFIHSNTTLPSSLIIFLYLLVMMLELNHSFFATIIVIGNSVPFMWISLVTGGLIALGSFFSLAFTSMGLLGLVLVQGIVQLSYNNWKWPLFICNEFKISFLTFLKLAFMEVYQSQKEYFYGKSKHGFFSNSR